jgi:ribosomal peptide maturation radical SAM protein 1
VRAPRVVLASLPWTTLSEPSLGLAILKSVLNEASIECRVRHLNLFALRHLRAATYCTLANVFALNDFLFAGAIDPHVSTAQRRWLRSKTVEALSYGLIDHAAHGGIDGVVDELLRLRQDVFPAWLGECADEIVASDPTLLGLTCMFDQTIASVALAALVKGRAPHVLVALGGYAVRTPTAEAIVGSFPWVDAVCVTEGEAVIEPLARASAGELALHDVPGLCLRDNAADAGVGIGVGVGRSARHTAPPPAVDMETVPDPDFDDFYADLERLDSEEEIEVAVDRLPVENSRGCWWGAAKHCVFCGIKDDDLVFRARSASRTIAALDALHDRYGVSGFRFSDYILPREYYKTLVPELIARGTKYMLTAEMKSNVTPGRFALLAEAGFTEVQPGIESFSTPVLRAMDKGVSAAQNVLTLMLGATFGVRVHYNLLYGFPSDRAEDYEALLASLPRLFHLDPPSTRLEVQVTRHAPLQVDPSRFGIAEAVYDPSYDLIFSADFRRDHRFDLGDFCYYYARPFENAPRLRRLYDAIDRTVDQWKRERGERQVELRVVADDGESMRIVDSRSCPSQEIVLRGPARDMLARCREPTSADRLVAASGAGALDELDERWLVFRDGDLVVSLVVDPVRPWAAATIAP